MKDGTKNSDDANANKAIREIAKRDETDALALRKLLDDLHNKKGHFLAVSANMGKSNSYISSQSLNWFANNVRFAAEQPMEEFREYRDEQGKRIKVNKKTLAQLSQRAPDWRRQIVMATYLSVREHRKFPPVLLVAYQDWIFYPNSENWGPDKRALEDSVTCKPLDSENLIVDFSESGTQFYALDGQHRLMGVKGLRELLDGNLRQKTKEGKIGKTLVTIDDILPYAPEGMSSEKFKSELQKILEEKIGLEIVPAVKQGETKEEAFERLRKIFVDVNQNARKLEIGELALLDETDGFCIVARRVMVSHPLFRDRNSSDDELLVEIKSGQLGEKSDNYTTLQALVEIAKLYLGQLDDFAEWKNEVCDVKGAGLLRPSDEQLKEGEKKLSAYFDAIGTLPSHKRMTQGKPVSAIRSSEGDGHDNILFRPITQEALADAIGALERERGITPEEVIKKLGRKDNSDEFNLRLTHPASPFFGILCDPIDKKMRRHEKHKKLAAKMFMYLLGGGIKEDADQEQLRKEVFESRRNTTEGEKPATAIGYDGHVKGEESFQLPPTW